MHRLSRYRGRIPRRHRGPSPRSECQLPGCSRQVAVARPERRGTSAATHVRVVVQRVPCAVEEDRDTFHHTAPASSTKTASSWLSRLKIGKLWVGGTTWTRWRRCPHLPSVLSLTVDSQGGAPRLPPVLVAGV